MSIDIEQLTISQIKQLAHLLSQLAPMTVPATSLINSRNIGKYVLVRSRNEGINAGFVVAADETGIVLSEARRIWYHRPADETAWYEGVANSGLRHDSRISSSVIEKVIVENYSITLCTDAAKDSIRGFKAHEQD